MCQFSASLSRELSLFGSDSSPLGVPNDDHEPEFAVSTMSGYVRITRNQISRWVKRITLSTETDLLPLECTSSIRARKMYGSPQIENGTWYLMSVLL